MPHLYAENQTDLGRLLDFVQARERFFFFMDPQRRLGLGIIPELLGGVGLSGSGTLTFHNLLQFFRRCRCVRSLMPSR